MNHITTPPTAAEYAAIIDTIERGFALDGINHKPNIKVAFALKLGRVTGMALSDIVKLYQSDFVPSGDGYRVTFTNRRRGTSKIYDITPELYAEIADYCERQHRRKTQTIIGIDTRQIQGHTALAARYLGYNNISAYSIRKGAQIEEGKNEY